MASAARELRYQQNGYLDGNLARDLDWAVRERELRHAGEAPRHQEREIVREKAEPKTRVQVRQRQHVSAVTLVGFAAVVGMAVMMLLGYIQLTVLAADTVELRSQLENLEVENEVLTAKYEQMFDLDTVREAAEAAGMAKPSASQICYLDISGGDRAVVYKKEDASVLSRALTSLNHGVYAVVEYFD